MQKLIILDSETGIAHIFNLGEGFFDDDDIESMVEVKGFNISSCQWMVALEIEDNTLINNTK